MKKKKSMITLIVVLVVAIFFAYLTLCGIPIVGTVYEIQPAPKGIVQGLDLQGGMYVVYELDFNGDGVVDELDEAYEPEDENLSKETLLASVIQIIRSRLDGSGLYDATISVETGSYRVTVEIPGVTNSEELADTLMSPAQLTFQDENGNIIMDGSMIKSANAAYINVSTPVVAFELDDEGTELFADFTLANTGKVLSIVLDDKAISEPTIESAITGGEGYIEGMGSIEDAKTLANLIMSGALPVNMVELQTRTVGATLGSSALQKSILAGIIGLACIVIFMIVYYKLPGLVASVSLLIYVMAELWILSLTHMTLTLPGIAGILLSIGMAVDANVVIFERIKEEYALGKSLTASVHSGFDRAIAAVADANITTIIAAVVLWVLGTGSVQGFAKTLFIGIVLSFITAIVLTRWFLKLILGLGIKDTKLYGVRRLEK